MSLFFCSFFCFKGVETVVIRWVLHPLEFKSRRYGGYRHGGAALFIEFRVVSDVPWVGRISGVLEAVPYPGEHSRRHL